MSHGRGSGRSDGPDGAGGTGDPAPSLTPTPPAADGSTDFLVTIQAYEGNSYVTGRVAFGRAADGRLVVQRLEMGRTGWVC